MNDTLTSVKRTMIAAWLFVVASCGDVKQRLMNTLLVQEVLATRQLALAEAQSFTADSRAQGTNLVGLIIGVMIAAIVVIRVFIPTVNDAIASSNVSGTTAAILGLLGLFAALLVLISLASPLMHRI